MIAKYRKFWHNRPQVWKTFINRSQIRILNAFQHNLHYRIFSLINVQAERQCIIQEILRSGSFHNFIRTIFFRFVIAPGNRILVFFKFDGFPIDMNSKQGWSDQDEETKELHRGRRPLNVWNIRGCITVCLERDCFFQPANNRTRLAKVIQWTDASETYRANGRRGGLSILAFTFDRRAIPAQDENQQNWKKEIGKCSLNGAICSDFLCVLCFFSLCFNASIYKKVNHQQGLEL